MATDLVCCMTMEKKTAEDTLTYQSTTLYCCSPTCLRHFEGHPVSFLTLVAAYSHMAGGECV